MLAVPAGRLVARSLIAMGLLACYDPSYQEGLECSSTGACPSGQQCFDGVCRSKNNTEPGVDAEIPVQCGVEVLATGANAVADIDARDGEQVFWTTGDSTLVLRARKDGTSIDTTLDDSGAGGSRPQAIVSTANHVYWTALPDPELGAQGHIFRKGKTEAAPQEADLVATGIADPRALAVFDDFVYWSDTASGQIRRVRASGGIPQDVALGEAGPGAIVVDGVHAYWINTATAKVRKLALDSGQEPVDISAGEGSAAGLVLGGDRLFWVRPDAGDIRSVSTAGGAIETLVDGQDSPRDLAYDAGYLYWVSYAAGEVWKFNLETKALVKIATAQPGPIAISALGEQAFWLNALSDEQRVAGIVCR